MGALALSVTLVPGCGLLGYGITHEVTPLDGANCVAPPPDATDSNTNTSTANDPVDVYWGPELPSRSFSRLAYLEVTGGNSTSTQELLNELRQQASACHATALVGVEKHFGVAEDSSLFSDDDDIVSQNVLTGVAVRYDNYPAAPVGAASSVQGWDE